MDKILSIQKKIAIEHLIAKTNTSKYHVIEGDSHIMSREYIQYFGLHGEGNDTQKVLNGCYTPPAATSAIKYFIFA